MTLKVEIAAHDDLWDEMDLSALSDQAVIAACAVLGKTPDAELSIAFVGDARIQELNRDYRHKDKPTNVLSFPMADPLTDVVMLGDIVIAYGTVKAEASAQEKTFENHLTHLIIHGFLHLLGYDHETDKDALEMETIEIAALGQLGIDNPYELKDFRCE